MLEVTDETQKVNAFESIINKYRWQVALLLVGVSLVGVSIYLSSGVLFTNNEVQVLGEDSQEDSLELGNLIVEVSGAVINPGVYRVASGARVEDLLVMAGGLSAQANREWVDRNLNRAQRVRDGEKVYIPEAGESLGETNDVSGVERLININSASLQELDALPGIGPVLGQKIIDNRPYSDISQLVERGALGGSVYEKIKEKISVY